MFPSSHRSPVLDVRVFSSIDGSVPSVHRNWGKSSPAVTKMQLEGLEKSGRQSLGADVFELWKPLVVYNNLGKSHFFLMKLNEPRMGKQWFVEEPLLQKLKELYTLASQKKCISPQRFIFYRYFMEVQNRSHDHWTGFRPSLLDHRVPSFQTQQLCHCCTGHPFSLCTQHVTSPGYYDQLVVSAKKKKKMLLN